MNCPASPPHPSSSGRTNRRFAVLTGLLLLACTGALSAATVTSPYSNDFSTGVDDFTETHDTFWNHDPTGQAYDFSLTSTGSLIRSSALLEVSNLGGAQQRDFLVTAQLDITGVYGRFGLVFLSDSNLLTASSDYYRVEIDRLSAGYGYSIGKYGSSLLSTSQNFPSGGPAGVWDFSLQGEYQPGGTLRMTFTLTRGATEHTLVLNDPTPYTGQHFGLFVAKDSAFSPVTAEVAFDDYAIVPEPSVVTAAALALGCGLLARRRQRPR